MGWRCCVGRLGRSGDDRAGRPEGLLMVNIQAADSDRPVQAPGGAALMEGCGDVESGGGVGRVVLGRWQRDFSGLLHQLSDVGHLPYERQGIWGWADSVVSGLDVGLSHIKL